MSKREVSTEDVEMYFKVGDIVHKVLEYSLDVVRPGAKVLEICEKLESRIRALGARPAFPVNIGINSVAAHYTAKINDALDIEEKSVVKIDVGAHIDGYIVDAAITLSFSPAYDGLVRAAYEALKSASTVIRPNVPLRRVGQCIERTIRSFNLRPVENLTGHLIRRYELHAGKSVPNVDNGDSRVMLEGEVYAVEPFVTNGTGHAVETNDLTIYRLAPRVKWTALTKYGHVIDVIREGSSGLPFALRWFVNKIKDIESLAISMLSEGVLYGYPVLVEEGNGLVAQFEDTFIVSSSGAVGLARTLELLR